LAKKINVKGNIVGNGDKWIYNWLGIEATSPKDVTQILDEVSGTEEIIIEINSGGGSVVAAHEIYTALVSYTGDFEIHVVGLAGSAASEILVAGKSKISPVGLVMIHNCSTNYVSGDYRDMDSASRMLQTVNKSIRNAYKAKTKLSDDELKVLMDQETWLSAEEAVERGFVDAVMFAEEEDEDPDDNKITNRIMNNRQVAIYNSTGSINSDVIDRLKCLIKQEEINNLIPENNEPTIHPTIDEQQAHILDNNNPKGGNNMTLDELFKEHPEVKDEVETLKVTAKQEGVTEERGRLQAIDNIAASVPKDMLDKAKYTEVMNASELALKLVSETAASGQNYFASALKDSVASGADGVQTPPADAEADAEDALINFAVKAANAKRKERK
jgi:ATP-dependent protease ClpP protease subunit